MYTDHHNFDHDHISAKMGDVAYKVLLQHGRLELSLVPNTAYGPGQLSLRSVNEYQL